MGWKNAVIACKSLSFSSSVRGVLSLGDWAPSSPFLTRRSTHCPMSFFSNLYFTNARIASGSNLSISVLPITPIFKAALNCLSIQHFEKRQ